MRISLLVLLLYAVLLMGCSRQNPRAEMEYVQIPGTSVRMPRHADYIMMPTIGGFQHKSLTSSILVQHVPTGLKDLMNEYRDSTLKTHGVHLLSRDSMQVGSIACPLFQTSQLSQGVQFRHWILFIPQGDHTILINGTYIDTDEQQLSALIRQLLGQVQVNSGTPSDSIATFTVDAKPLMFASVLPGPGLLFTETGKWQETDIHSYSFFVGPSGPQPTLQPSLDFALGQFREICAHCKPKEEDVKAVVVDSLSGYEIFTHIPADAVYPEKIKYQMVLFDKEQYFLMVGTAQSNKADALATFRKIGFSFRRKKPNNL